MEICLFNDSEFTFFFQTILKNLNYQKPTVMQSMYIFKVCVKIAFVYMDMDVQKWQYFYWYTKLLGIMYIYLILINLLL